MNTIFWNIDDSFDDNKEKSIIDLIEVEEPDIFCIAEGMSEKEDIEKIEKIFVDRDYNIYFSPKKYNVSWPFCKYSLKIFYKKYSKLTETIEPFFEYKEEKNGRIISLDFKFENKKTKVIYKTDKESC